METLEKLIPGNFYHIYNHGVGNRNLFQKTENYEHFLQKYDKYIPPIADTYAWVLMPNHFHMLVKVKELAVFIPDSDRVSNPLRDIKRNRKIEDIPSLQFSKLFNSYAQAFNKYFETHGALFERPFKRKLVDSIDYLRELVVYIHNNPVHHGFYEHLIEYPWSSYLTCTSDKTTKLKRDEVINWFGGKANFRAKHEEKSNKDEIDKWLDL